jgi:hypothetical protein
MGEVGISLNSLTPPLCCACLKQRSRFLLDYVVVISVEKVCQKSGSCCLVVVEFYWRTSLFIFNYGQNSELIKNILFYMHILKRAAYINIAI